MIRFVLKLNNNEILVSADQLERIMSALDGAVFVDTRYKGNNKGFYGPACEYEAEFLPFNPLQIGNVQIMSQEQYDKVTLIAEMRKKEDA